MHGHRPWDKSCSGGVGRVRIALPIRCAIRQWESKLSFYRLFCLDLLLEFRQRAAMLSVTQFHHTVNQSNYGAFVCIVSCCQLCGLNAGSILAQSTAVSFAESRQAFGNRYGPFGKNTIACLWRPTDCAKSAVLLNNDGATSQRL